MLRSEWPWWINRFQSLTALDAFQLTKAQYALAVLVAWHFRLNEASATLVSATLRSIGVPPWLWLTFLFLYAVSAASCLVWRNRNFQTMVSFISLWLWTFYGTVSLLSTGSPAAGIFQMQLAVVSAIALYHWGRRSDYE